ncbi:NAD(P)/FAD-dependent oxidoreductase [Emcibacter nanhaiensis]|uniref:NAD(P)/FAD-dependent oxidoreductase n=1 Tax=Emcibacter nanhaiensis TaxID=1505037 RepID=UPI001C612162|nr:NAD(P)/FAD-dependent oxidoreductase [Emcibacter nanhaiensis]
MDIFEVDTVVIGAGVVGLACARALARAGHEVYLLEKENTFGTGISSRNSEVIHAGLYYPPDSLKAELCVRGNRMMRQFCDDFHVDYRMPGKLVVATTEEEIAKLEIIKANAEQCEVTDLTILNRQECRVLEPELEVLAALHSPSSGIVDSHGLMLALLGDAEAHGTVAAYGAEMTGISTAAGGGFIVSRDDPSGDRIEILCQYLVNAAGLGATRLASTFRELDPQTIPRTWFAKGNYFSYAGKLPFRHLIYPVPTKGSLGTHLTPDLGGQGKFGPDIQWVTEENYDVDESRKPLFVNSIRKYWPGLDENRLQPAYSGIRPKVVAPDIASQDFIIQGPRDHGLQGFVNLMGIESPGLTSSLAIAEKVVAKIGD